MSYCMTNMWNYPAEVSYRGVVLKDCHAAWKFTSSESSEDQTHADYFSWQPSRWNPENDPVAVGWWQRLLPAAIPLAPPSLYQEEEAHSDSPLSCFSRFKFWESLEVTRWPGLHWFGPPSTLHSPVKAGLRRRRRRLQEKNTAEEEPVLAADGKRTACEYPIVLIVAGERISKVMLPEKLITRKYSIPDWMQGIDFFVRSSVFLSRGTGYEGWIVSNIIKN